jgi:hypothetical protein
VKDPEVHKAVISKVTSAVEAWGFRSAGCIESPIKGDKSGEHRLECDGMGCASSGWMGARNVLEWKIEEGRGSCQVKVGSSSIGYV